MPLSIEMRTSTTRGWMVVLCVALAGCPADDEEDPGPGRGETPSDVAGGWYAGNVSDTHIIDGGGGFTSAYGTGLVFRFRADGSYEKSVLIQRSDGLCRAQFLGYSRGVVEITGDDAIELHPTDGKVKSVDSCVAEWNYERADEPSGETLYWERADDATGEVLILRSPTSSPTAFRPAR